MVITSLCSVQVVDVITTFQNQNDVCVCVCERDKHFTV